MLIHEDLMKIIACPVCKGDIVVDEDNSSLNCDACRLKFPVKDGIPVMLENEAVPYND